MGRFVAILALVGAFAAGARAQGSDAEAAFRRGRALMAQGKVDAACVEFELSMKLDAQHGTLYNLALCHEAQGKHATAYAEMQELAEKDTNEGRRAEAARRAAAMKRRVPRLRIAAPAKRDGLVVRRDGVDVTDQLGREVPVDPGTYKLEATAPGRDPVTWEVAVKAEGDVVEVAIPGEQGTTATSYPTEVPLRPLALPRGLIAVDGWLTLYDSSSFARDPIDLEVAGAIGLGRIEIGIGLAANLRTSDPDTDANLLARVSARARYLLTPDFTAGVDVTLSNPTRSGQGIELRAGAARKWRFARFLALVAHPTALYQRYNSSGGPVDLFALRGSGAVQASATSRLSAELLANLDVYLGGELKPENYVGVSTGLRVLFSITKKLDVWGSAVLSIYPGSSGYKYFQLGATQRLP